MDSKKLNEAIVRLAELDPADVPEAADQIAEALAAQLELSDEPEGDQAG